MGFILQSKGDREMVYIARKKFNQADQTIRNANINMANSDAISTSNMGPDALPNSTVVTTIREITKKRFDDVQTNQLKSASLFLESHRHENLLQVWGLFWDDKKVYFIHEPAIKQVELPVPPQHTEQEQMAQHISAIDFIKDFTWTPTEYNHELAKYVYKNPRMADQQRLND